MTATTFISGLQPTNQLSSRSSKMGCGRKNSCRPSQRPICFNFQYHLTNRPLPENLFKCRFSKTAIWIYTKSQKARFEWSSNFLSNLVQFRLDVFLVLWQTFPSGINMGNQPIGTLPFFWQPLDGSPQTVPGRSWGAWHFFVKVLSRFVKWWQSHKHNKKRHSNSPM